MATPLPIVTAKDMASDQEIRWCPGCGDFSILAQLKKVLAEGGVPREKVVFVSGIGCSSRLPYYLNTYGFQTIHGRAPAFATGLRLARPDLQVWVVTGDGDGLSVGGNHLIHALRRNVDIKILLFNNETFGLMRGQYSPTSRTGTRTKSSPQGSVEAPLRPLSLALAAEATFAARTVDVDIQHLSAVLQRAAAHRGSAFVEIYQNCKIFNDGVFDYATDRAIKSDHAIYLEHGRPLIYGRDRNRGLRLNGLNIESALIGVEAQLDDLITHDEAADEPTLAALLGRMVAPELPECLGVLRAVSRPTLEGRMQEQADEQVAAKGAGDLDRLFRDDDLWTVA